MIRFKMPYPRGDGKRTWAGRFGLNAYWAGKNRHARAKDAREIHAMVRAALLAEKIPRNPVEYPVSVLFEWDDRLDIDNHAALGKMILDATRGWIVRNDDRRFVKQVAHKFWSGGEIRVTFYKMTKNDEE